MRAIKMGDTWGDPIATYEFVRSPSWAVMSRWLPMVNCADEDMELT